MKSIMGLSSWFVKRHLRGPLIPLVIILFVALAVAQPTLGDPGSALRHRGLVALLIGTGGLVLMLIALVLPHASVAMRRQTFPGGGPPLPGRQLGAFLGHGLTLMLITCLLTIACQGLVRLRIGDPDARGSKPLVRSIWGHAPEARTRLPLDGTPLFLEFPFADLPREQPVVRVRMAPSLFLDREHAGTPEHGLVEGAIDFRWKVKGSKRRPEHQVLRFSRGRAETVTLRLRESTDVLQLEGGDWLSGTLQIELKRRGGGQVPVFDPHSIVFLGTRSSALSTVVKSYLLLGLSALAILAVCQWFSGFVSYPLAVGATLTVILATTFATSWLPELALVDPSERVALGTAVSWSDLAGTGWRVAAAGALLVLVPLIDGRGGGAVGGAS